MAIRQQQQKNDRDDAAAGCRFRAMRRADLAAVLRIERQCFADPWARESFVKELEEAPRLRWPLVALCAREPVGYVIVWFIEDEAHIANLAISPAWRGRGLGRELLVRALAEAQGRGVASMALEVRASNTAAIALYRASGFRPCGVCQDYYSDTCEDAILMIRKFDEQPARGDRAGEGRSQTEA